MGHMSRFYQVSPMHPCRAVAFALPFPRWEHCALLLLLFLLFPIKVLSVIPFSQQVLDRPAFFHPDVEGAHANESQHCKI